MTTTKEQATALLPIGLRDSVSVFLMQRAVDEAEAENGLSDWAKSKRRDMLLAKQGIPRNEAQRRRWEKLGLL